MNYLLIVKFHLILFFDILCAVIISPIIFIFSNLFGYGIFFSLFIACSIMVIFLIFISCGFFLQLRDKINIQKIIQNIDKLILKKPSLLSSYVGLDS